jgi:hypothetical protein
MEEGAEELMSAPEMQPYLRHIEVVMLGGDVQASMKSIAELPLEKRYIWRVTSAFKWAFADFDSWNVAVDKKTLIPEDAAKVMQLLGLRLIQFCLFMRALVGTEQMETIMLNAIGVAKQDG